MLLCQQLEEFREQSATCLLGWEHLLFCRLLTYSRRSTVDMLSGNEKLESWHKATFSQMDPKRNTVEWLVSS